MAELIPMEYRIATAQGECVHRWGFVLVLAAMVAGAGLISAYNVQSKHRQAFDQVNASFTLKSMIKKESRRLIDQRQDVARRMAKIEEVQDDKALLGLLAGVTQQFSDNDVLEDISVEVHGRGGDERPGQGGFSVRVGAVTKNYDSWNELIDRLTKASAKSTPQMAIKPGSSSDARMLEGAVVRFQVTFDPPAKVADASTGDH